MFYTGYKVGNLEYLQAFVGLVAMPMLIVTTRQAARCKQKNIVKTRLKYVEMSKTAAYIYNRTDIINVAENCEINGATIKKGFLFESQHLKHTLSMLPPVVPCITNCKQSTQRQKSNCLSLMDKKVVCHHISKRKQKHVDENKSLLHHV
jgi:hypothetical protein